MQHPQQIFVTHLNDIDILFDLLKLLRTSLAAKRRMRLRVENMSSKKRTKKTMQAGGTNLTCFVMRRV
jgi:hypothetical protein